MSVVLTACRHSKQRAIARALKKRAEKQKLKKETELQQLEAIDPAFTKLWSFSVEGEDYTVVLYLAGDKDTVDIFCNEDEVKDVMTNVSHEGCSFDFVIGASYKARISCNCSSDGLIHSLSIDGCCVPEVQ